MELEKLSDKELLELKKKIKNRISFCEVQQHTRKILSNSFYGGMANSFFRWFDLRIPSSITLTGQWYIKQISKDLNEFLNEMIKEKHNWTVAGDTDSVYISFKPLVDKMLEKNPNLSKKEIAFKILSISKKLNKFIQDKFIQYGKSKNIFEDIMKMKRENIIDVAVWTAKKHYISNILIDESGIYDENREYKIMGVEIIKSSTPKSIKDDLKKCLKLILNKNEEELKIFVKKMKNKFRKMDVEEIAFPRGISNIDKFQENTKKDSPLNSYIKGTPIHAKGCIFYNWLVKNKNSKRNYIKEKSKIKFVYLKEMNPWKMNSIAFPDDFPSELIDKKYIDYNTQFEKTFLSIIKSITDNIGWNLFQKKFDFFF